MPSKKTQLVWHASQEMRDALDQWAVGKNLSMAEVVRRAVAKEIGYDIGREVRTKAVRASKYMSEEERRVAALERAKIRRAIAADIRAAIKSGDLETVKRLAEKM